MREIQCTVSFAFLFTIITSDELPRSPIRSMDFTSSAYVRLRVIRIGREFGSKFHFYLLINLGLRACRHPPKLALLCRYVGSN